MAEEKTEIKVDKKPQKKRGKLRRWIKFIAIIAVLISLLQYVCYYYAFPLLKETVCKNINVSTSGLYTMNFDDFKINFLTKSLEVENFSLVPDTAVYLKLIDTADYNKAVYNISVKKLQVKNISLFAFLRDRLRINKIILDNPRVSLAAKPKKEEGKKKYDAVHKDLFPIIEPFLNALIINSVTITDGYFDFSTKVKNDKSNIEVAKIDLNLKKFYLDKEAHQKRDKLFFSQVIELNSENYNIILADNVHTVKAAKLYINTADSLIYAQNARLCADGKNCQNTLANKFNVLLDSIKITGVDLSAAYFQKNVNLKTVKIFNPGIEFLKGGVVNKKTQKFEQFSSDWFPLIKGMLKSVSADSLKVENANLKIAKSSKPQKPVYKADNINIRLDGFLLDSMAFSNKEKILYSKGIEIKLADFQMVLPDNRHKLFSGEVLVSTIDKTLKAKKIVIRPTYKTNDSTAKEINIKVPSVEIIDFDLIKGYNQKNYEMGMVKVSLPDIETKSFIDTAKTPDKSNHRLIDVLSDEFFKMLKIRTLLINKGNINITSKASIKQDSLTLSGKLSLNISNFIINRKTLSDGGLPFITTNVNFNIRDAVMKLPKNFHTMRCAEFSLNSKKDKVLIEKFSFKYDSDTMLLSTMKRLKKSSSLDISIEKAEFNKFQLLDLFFKQEINLEKLLVLKPKFYITIYPQLAALKEERKLLEDTLQEVRDSLQDSVYQLYTVFDKILADMLPKSIKFIKTDTLFCDSSILSFDFRDTTNGVIASTSSDFRFLAEGFYFNRDSFSNEENFMLAQNYGLDINNFEFLMPDRAHLVRTSNINVSTKDSCIKIKSVMISERPHRRFPVKNVMNLYLPEVIIDKIDFKTFGKTGILPAGSLFFDKAAFILAKNIDFKEDSLKMPPKTVRKKNIPFKGVAFDEVRSEKSGFAFYRGGLKDMFKTEVAKMNFDIKLENFSLDSANLNKNGYVMDFDNPFLDVNNFRFTLKDSSQILVDNVREVSDSLKVKGFFWGFSDNPKRTKVIGPEILLTDVKYPDLIFSKKIIGRFLDIKSPRIEIFPGNKKTGLDNVLYKMFNTIDFQVDTVTSDNVSMDINLRNGKPKVELRNMDLNISELNTQKYRSRDIPGKTVLAGITDHTFYMKDSIFRLNFPRAVLEPNKKTVQIKSMDFRPYTNRYDFCKAFDVSRTATYISCENALAKNFDWKTAIEHKTLNMDSLYLNKLSFTAYMDNSKPNGTEIQPTLLQWLDRIPFFINVKTSKITDSYLGIEQLNPLGAVPGILTFNNLSGYIYDLSNDPMQIGIDDTLTFSMKAKLMNVSDISGSFRYPRISPVEEFYCKIKADTVYLPYLNPFLENALFAKINDGMLYGADISFRSDNKSSKGVTRFVYSDLKFAINKADSVKEKKRGLLSLIANIFVKKKNTKKRGYIYAEPDYTRGFSSYWVKSILSGVKATFGFESKEQKDERKLTEKVRDAITRGKQRKKLEKINQE